VLLVKLWSLLQIKEKADKSSIDFIIDVIQGKKKIENDRKKWEEWLNILCTKHNIQFNEKEHFILAANSHVFAVIHAIEIFKLEHQL
jgi:hypothetical protein